MDTRNIHEWSKEKKAEKLQGNKDTTNKKFLIIKLRARDRNRENICHTYKKKM